LPVTRPAIDLKSGYDPLYRGPATRADYRHFLRKGDCAIFSPNDKKPKSFAMEKLSEIYFVS